MSYTVTIQPKNKFHTVQILDQNNCSYNITKICHRMIMFLVVKFWLRVIAVTDSHILGCDKKLLARGFSC